MGLCDPIAGKCKWTEFVSAANKCSLEYLSDKGSADAEVPIACFSAGKWLNLKAGGNWYVTGL